MTAIGNLFTVHETLTTKKSLAYPYGIFQNYKYISIPKIWCVRFYFETCAEKNREREIRSNGHKFPESGGLLLWVYTPLEALQRVLPPVNS
jgi:hypothetical protein